MLNLDRLLISNHAAIFWRKVIRGLFHLIKQKVKKLAKSILTAAVLSSNRSRGESELKAELVKIVPDISKQYTTFDVAENDTYLNENIRCLHAFQISLALRAVNRISLTTDNKHLNIVDIGDSSGTHILYLNEILSRRGINATALSVNLDPIAVEKIKAKGLHAIHCRAEELSTIEGGVDADIFLLYETLEHLFDPVSFLHTLSTKTNCQYLVLTVPYLVRSRVGLQHLRLNTKAEMYAENTHIFELCPSDWNLLFRFSGWKIVEADIYTQYPKWGLLNFAKYIWRKFAFDGFYGVILERDHSVSNRYKSW